MLPAEPQVSPPLAVPSAALLTAGGTTGAGGTTAGWATAEGAAADPASPVDVPLPGSASSCWLAGGTLALLARLRGARLVLAAARCPGRRRRPAQAQCPVAGAAAAGSSPSARLLRTGICRRRLPQAAQRPERAAPPPEVRQAWSPHGAPAGAGPAPGYRYLPAGPGVSGDARRPRSSDASLPAWPSAADSLFCRSISSIRAISPVRLPGAAGLIGPLRATRELFVRAHWCGIRLDWRPPHPGTLPIPVPVQRPARQAGSPPPGSWPQTGPASAGGPDWPAESAGSSGPGALASAAAASMPSGP